MKTTATRGVGMVLAALLLWAGVIVGAAGADSVDHFAGPNQKLTEIEARLADVEARVTTLENPAQPVEPTATPTQTPATGLVFADEFNGTGVDTSRWTNGQNSWGGNTYHDNTFDPANAAVSNGTLKLRVEKRRHSGEPFAAGQIHSKGKAEFATGRVEIRARYDTSSGMWPALWLLHDRHTKVGTEEIDLMEVMTSKPDEVYHNYHWYPSDGNHQQYNKWMGREAGFGGKWHTYVVEFDTTTVRYVIDGVQTWEHARKLSPAPVHIILTHAAGGWGGNYPNSDTVYPHVFEIDYVRVYQK